MNFVQLISDFFKTLFSRNSPEIQKKLKFKKIEAELRSYEPYIFKNGNLLPNFAEAIRILYINTKPLDDLLSSTIASTDLQKNKRFQSQLVLTGFTTENQNNISLLSYENRKKEVIETTLKSFHIYDRQHKRLEKIIQELNEASFKKMDEDLIYLQQLADLCKFSFVTILQVFDSNFIALDHKYKPEYQEVSIEKLGSTIEDLYYQVATLKITNGTANAIQALASLKYGQSFSQSISESLIGNLKKISYILRHIITTERLKLLIAYYKQDLDYVPKVVEYKDSARKNFSELIQNQFKSDELRIKTELKDEKISNELQILFPTTQLLSLNGYNNTSNESIQNSTNFSFMWIMPLQILKTFITIYFSEGIRSLLNDIIVEGFFNNPTYKTDFSSIVFSAFEISQVIGDFEDSFTSGKRNDLATLNNYIYNSHKDSDFLKKTEHMINNINVEANNIITKQTNILKNLSKYLEDLLQDSKKPTCELISNLKMLMISPRNRDNTNLLEEQYSYWGNFFEIMKNYAIISNREI